MLHRGFLIANSGSRIPNSDLGFDFLNARFESKILNFELKFFHAPAPPRPVGVRAH